MRDESFYLFTRGIAKGFHSAEVGGIGLDQVGIELMLADDLTESMANRTTAISVGWLGRQLLRFRRRLASFRQWTRSPRSSRCRSRRLCAELGSLLWFPLRASRHRGPERKHWMGRRHRIRRSLEMS